MSNLVAVATEQPTIAMIVKSNPKGFADSIASIVSEVIQISGRKDMSDADKAFLILKTKEEIENEYRFMTGAEVRYAFSQGVRGRFGDYYHINLPTFIKWLDKYLESDERQRIVDGRQKKIPVTHQLAQSNPISDRDMVEIYRQRAGYCYTKFLESGKVAISDISSLQKMLESFTLNQLIKDGKAKKGESLEDVFKRYRDNGKESIY